MAVASGFPTWRSLAAGLVRPAARAIAVHAAVVTGCFLVGAWALHRAWFAGGSAVLHGVGAVGVFPLFAAAGVLTGVGLGVTSTLRALLARLESECGRQLQPLVRHAVEAALGGEPATSIEGFRAALDRHFGMVAAGAGWGPLGLFPRLLGGIVIRLVRFGLERQLLRRLEREGQSMVTLDALARFGRDKLVGLLLDQARARVSLAHAVLLAVTGLATLGPLVSLILRGP